MKQKGKAAWERDAIVSATEIGEWLGISEDKVRKLPWRESTFQGIQIGIWSGKRAGIDPRTFRQVFFG